MNKTQKALALLTLSLTMLSARVSTPLPNEEESFTIGVIQLLALTLQASLLNSTWDLKISWMSR